jgi:8-oxo-dGTP diphosphatase
MGRDDQGLWRGRGRYQVVPRMLCFVTHGDDVLLLRVGAHKKLWAGLYNGVGGHLEPGEDVQSAVKREVREETGLDARQIRLRGVVHVDVDNPVLGVLFFVFTAAADDKRVVASSEGALAWFRASALPTQEMVEDLHILLPRVLSMAPTDPPFFALYAYDEKDRLLISFAEPG